MDWRLEVICVDCGLRNFVSREEFRTDYCTGCATRLGVSSTVENYIPNQVSPVERVASLFGAFALFALSIHTVEVQHIRLGYGGGRGRSSGLEFDFTGAEITLPVISLMLAAIGVLSVFLDHYDKRQNEHIYRKTWRYSLGLGYGLYWLSIFFGQLVR